MSLKETSFIRLQNEVSAFFDALSAVELDAYTKAVKTIQLSNVFVLSIVSFNNQANPIPVKLKIISLCLK